MYVVATAGHVDHGKSTLVRALTGMEPDRWAEERRRGMTIDLGYAWMALPDGEKLAFVDVPGHERFVPNMLAGLGPVPAVLFVVAADGGWMPQSAEHLAAVDALAVRHGLLVVTRADLADPEPATRVALAEIARTSLGSVEAVAVSAVTGAGLDDLRAALARLAAALHGQGTPGAPPVRLWIDRSFTVRGAGTVVTGTLPAGTVANGQELLLTRRPAVQPVRVRGLQALGEPAERVTGVARVALNLRGVPTGVPQRGMALIEPGRWTLTAELDVRLTPRAAGLPDKFPPELLLHVGSARTQARLRLLGEDSGAVYVRLRLRDPLPLHAGDRVLLRDPGAAGLAIYGATVLDPAPPPLGRRGAAAAAVRELAIWPDPPSAADLLRRHRLLRTATLTAMGITELPPPVAADWHADPAHWARLRAELPTAVAAFMAKDELAVGMPLDAARAALNLPTRDLIAALVTPDPSTRLRRHGYGCRAGPRRYGDHRRRLPADCRGARTIAGQGGAAERASSAQPQASAAATRPRRPRPLRCRLGSRALSRPCSTISRPPRSPRRTASGCVSWAWMPGHSPRRRAPGCCCGSPTSSCSRRARTRRRPASWPSCRSRSPRPRPGRRSPPPAGWRSRCWSTSTAPGSPSASPATSAASAPDSRPAQLSISSVGDNLPTNRTQKWS